MNAFRLLTAIGTCLLFHTLSSDGSAESPNANVVIQRALKALSHEVDQWPRKNKCYSCHNNGDAARALYTAKRLGYDVSDESLAQTNDWLTHPQRWRDNGGEGIFNEKKLANIQFGSALVDLDWAMKENHRESLMIAAKLVAKDQEADGSWKVEPAGNLGSPATYGNTLATVSALRLLQTADAQGFRDSIGKAQSWLISRKPNSTVDAAATLLGLEGLQDSPSVKLRSHCLSVLKRGQDKSGGWGPYVVSPAEPFDTAISLVALSHQTQSSERDSLIKKGRRFLLNSQADDGLWIETTRPSGAESYAQRLSTSGWATLALLLTSERNAGAKETDPSP
jgi:hypothetical protein